MTNIRILAVEDSPIDAEIIRLTVEETGYELIDVFSNGQEALQAIKLTKPDLILLDVRISGPLNGIELAKKIGKGTPLIFITSLREREIFEKAKEVQPYAFILKPFDALMLRNTIELAVSNLAGEKKDVWKDHDLLMNDSFFIKEKNTLIKVLVKDILYIKSEEKYCYLFTTTRKHIVRISVKEMMSKIPKNFIQIHRSYIVDSQRIDRVVVEDLVLNIDGSTLPIGVSFKENVLGKLNKL